MSHTIVQTDENDEFDWDTITTTYHDDEVSPAIVVTDFDDGRLQKQTFAEDGTPLGTGILYDGGVREAIFYPDAGTIVHVIQDTNAPDPDPTDPPDPDLDYTIFDLGDYLPDPIASDPPDPVPDPGEGGYHPWLQQTWTGNTATGEIVHEVVGNDGTAWRHSFQGNLEGMIVERDDLDSEPWDTRIITFLPDGVTAEQRVTLLDDGDFRLEIFDADENVIENRWVDADQDGDELWQTVTTIYTDSDIFVDARETVYDVGVVQYETFQEIDNNNFKVSMIVTDEEDAFDWDTITTTYHPDGVTPYHVVTLFDDGLERQESYFESGILSLSTDIDHTDLFDWQASSVRRFDDGTVFATGLEWDSGIIESEFYSPDGHLFLRGIQDLDGQVIDPNFPADPPEGLHFWKEQDWTRDASTGEIEHLIVLNDDTETSISFSGSLVGLEVDLDTDDLEDWDTIARFYHTGSTTLHHRETVFDDGSILLESFDATGTLDETVETDADDEFDWDTITTTYHPDGVTPSMVVTVFDNGVERRETYRTDGSLQMWVEYDLGDAFDWDGRSEQYETDGALSTESQFFDDGYGYINQYINGSLAVLIEFDGEEGTPGLYDWETRNTHYNTDGDVIGGATTFDNGIWESNIIEDGVEWFHVVADTDGVLNPDPADVASGGLHFWKEQTWTKDTITGDVQHVITLNDGTELTFDFDWGLTGRKSVLDGMVVELDSDNTEVWDTIVTFAPDELTSQYRIQTLFDDGTVSLETFGSTGNLRETFLADVPGNASWDTIHTTYYGPDRPNEITTVFDNGMKRFEFFSSDGRRYTIIDQDTTDLYDWSQITTSYESSWGDFPRNIETRFDDGLYRQESFRTDGTLSSITERDNGFNFDWEWRTTIYNAEGEAESKRTYFDNGSETLITFGATTETVVRNSNGQVVQTVLEDTDDLEEWDTITTVYHDDGVTPSEITTVFDDGVERYEEFYEDGDRAYVSEVDADDAHNWSAYAEHYDLRGDLLQSVLDYDDGAWDNLLYHPNGVVSNVWLKDSETDGGDHPWYFYLAIHETDGSLHGEAWVFDNATEISRGLKDDGSWLVVAWDSNFPDVTFADPESDGLHFWQEQTWDQTEDGVTVEHTITLNDGSEISNSFTGDVETLEVQLDSDDLEDWDTIATTFYEDGTTVEVMFDDGVIATGQFSESGEPVSVTWRDLLDAHDWDLVEIDYFSGGSVVSRRETWFDDGVYRDEVYQANGNPLLAIDWDIEDAYDWTLMATRHDESGEVTASQIDYDNGYQFIEYFEGGMLFATTELDGWGTELGEVPGLYDWYTRTYQYGDDGTLQAISITLDDGTFDGFFYEDEILVERRIYDSNYLYGEPDEPIPGGLHDWYSQIWTYDSEGNLTSHRIVWDNGDVSLTDYGTYAETTWTDSDGDVTEIILEDVNDKKGWDTITWRFDDVGEKDFEEIVYDDGRIRTTVWEAGILVSLDWQDPADVKSWDTISSSYDENGVLAEKTTVRDDGIRTEELWEEGVRASILQTDVQDAVSWERIEIYYDEYGQLFEKYTLLDDGQEKTELWEDGVRASIVQTDAQDAVSWERIEAYYDENGKLAGKYTLLDNGREKQEFWEDGVRTSILETDDEDAVSWERIETYYDENGRAESRVTLYDDGRTRTVLWEDGVLVSVTDTDPDDAVDWVDITTLYDGNGDFLSQVKNYDNGDVTEVFVPTTTQWDVDDLEAERVTRKSNLGDEKAWAEIETIEFEGKYYLTRVFWDNENLSSKFFMPFDELGDVKFEGVIDVADERSWEEQSTARMLDLGRKEIYQRDDDQDEDLRHINLDTDVLEFHGQKDGSDVEDWAAQHSHYDAAGDLERIETHFDDGHFEITYFSGGVATGTDILTEAEYEAAHGDFYDYWDWYGPIEFATTA